MTTTPDKRAASMFVGSPWRMTLPVPNGVIGSENRAHAAYQYPYAYPVSSPEAAAGAAEYVLTLRRRRKG